MKVATRGEDTGFEVPCLIVPAKDDLDPSPMAVQESTRVSTLSLKLPATISHLHMTVTSLLRHCCCLYSFLEFNMFLPV